MTISYNVGLEHMGRDFLNKMGKLLSVNNLVGNTVDLDNINLLALTEFENNSRQHKNKNSKLFLIKINKGYSNLKEELYLTPKEWQRMGVIYKYNIQKCF
jgi:hypothetical protein